MHLIFDDPVSHVYNTQMASSCKRPLGFFGGEFQIPMSAYSREQGTDLQVSMLY